MTQVKPFIISNAGTKPYWCLQNVRLGYGIGPRYAYALQDWINNLGQHKDQSFPAGLAVPVYWNWSGTVDGIYRNWGHIGVRLPDGRIWTDGKYFNSVSEVSSKYLSGGSYLGWGESVEGVRVIKLGDGMGRTLTDAEWKENIKLAYRMAGWREPTSAEINIHYPAGTPNSVLAGFKTEVEGRKKRYSDLESSVKKLTAEKALLQIEVTNLKNEIAKQQIELKNKDGLIEEAGNKIAEQGKQIESLNKQLAECGQDEVGSWLEKLINWFKNIWKS